MDEATDLVVDHSIRKGLSWKMTGLPFQVPYQIPSEASCVYTPMHVTFLVSVDSLLIAKIAINVFSCNQLHSSW